MMRDKWMRFYRMSGRDKVLMFRAAGLLVAYTVSLRALGFKRTVIVSRSSSWSRFRALDQDEADFPARALAAVKRARRLLGVGTCLSCSLVTRSLLASAGIPADVRIGTRRSGATLDAHAWVEHRARSTRETLDESYTPFPSRL